MNKVEITCGHCGSKVLKEKSAVNRARKIGAGLYCNRTCSGRAKAARRVLPKYGTPEWKEHKRAYDKHRRAEKADEIKAKKKAAYQAKRDEICAANRALRAYLKTNDPDGYWRRFRASQARIQSGSNWKEAKAKYDHTYRNQRRYGEMKELAEAVQALEKACREREDPAQRRLRQCREHQRRYNLGAGYESKAKGRRPHPEGSDRADVGCSKQGQERRYGALYGRYVGRAGEADPQGPAAGAGLSAVCGLGAAARGDSGVHRRSLPAEVRPGVIVENPRGNRRVVVGIEVEGGEIVAVAWHLPGKEYAAWVGRPEDFRQWMGRGGRNTGKNWRVIRP